MSIFDDLYCPCCNDDQVIADGPEDSPILFIGAYPGVEEIKQGLPMVGSMGRVLDSEIDYLGYNMKSFRITNLWLHPPNSRTDCFDNGVKECLKDAKGKQAILLMGAEPVWHFCNERVTTVTGLFLKSDMLTAPIIMAMTNPAIVFQEKQTVGETRLALRKFIERLQKEKIL